MELNQERIEAAIVQEAADRLIDEDRLSQRVQKLVDDKINALFKERAEALVQAAVDDAIKSGFEREYTRVNAFGQKDGQPTSIRRELEKLIGGYWNEKVDSQGKKSTHTSERDLTRAEWVMAQLVAKDFNAQMTQHVVNVGGALKDKLRASVHETVNQMLSEVFRVNSLGDQEIAKCDGKTGYVGNLPKA